MRRSPLLVAGVAGAALLAGCGGRQAQATREQQSFACRDRVVSYVASHHLGGDELGIQMDCATAGPRIQRWRVGKDGTRTDDARGMTPGEFDRVWKEIDGSGWGYLKDCTNGSGGKQDPVYVFDVKDDQQQGSFQCQSVTMPYPYNTIVDALDLAAQQGRRQLGDDEPDDLKALDRPARKGAAK